MAAYVLQSRPSAQLLFSALCWLLLFCVLLASIVSLLFRYMPHVLASVPFSFLVNFVRDAYYGWTGQQSGSGFSDIARPALGVFASLDRFWALQLMH
jgi:hypothetical protein